MSNLVYVNSMQKLVLGISFYAIEFLCGLFESRKKVRIIIFIIRQRKCKIVENHFFALDVSKKNEGKNLYQMRNSQKVINYDEAERKNMPPPNPQGWISQIFL